MSDTTKTRKLHAVDPAAHAAALERFGANLRHIMTAGYIPGVHLLSTEVRDLERWSEERCRFHRIEELANRRPGPDGVIHHYIGLNSYRFYLRAEIERHSTPEHTQRWIDHLAAEQDRTQRERVDAENHEIEFATRQANGTLITRQEILAKGWTVPAEPDFVQPLGRGRKRYWYRLPLPVAG